MLRLNIAFVYTINIVLVFILLLLVLVSRCFAGREINSLEISVRYCAHKSRPLDTNMSQFNPFTTSHLNFKNVF